MWHAVYMMTILAQERPACCPAPALNLDLPRLGLLTFKHINTLRHQDMFKFLLFIYLFICFRNGDREKNTTEWPKGRSQGSGCAEKQ